MFQRYWGVPFEWKFDALPSEGTIPNSRLPYSGYIYPDKSGGTSSALRKYDLAFNGGRMRATAYEQWDTTAFKKPTEQRVGLFGLGRRTVMETPNWHGHCNGWVAATIRHAEPENSVRINGVTFSPADVKALLAEIYIYNDIEHLAGLDWPMNAGLLHTILANWLGRGEHPVGMEGMPGPEKWNYPIYSFSTDAARRSDRQVEVKMNIAYAKDSNSEYQESPHIRRVRYFHYLLNLNDRGEIIGGSFFNDSGALDMLWIPMRPKQGGTKGNEPGNPHVDVDKVLAVWRASVPEENRKHWLAVDPAEQDRVTDLPETDALIPLQVVGQPQPSLPAAPTTPTPPATTTVGPTSPARRITDQPATNSGATTTPPSSTGDRETTAAWRDTAAPSASPATPTRESDTASPATNSASATADPAGETPPASDGPELNLPPPPTSDSDVDAPRAAERELIMD
jgi:hypothetical protein